MTHDDIDAVDDVERCEDCGWPTEDCNCLDKPQGDQTRAWAKEVLRRDAGERGEN
jgi:hypothetical protein